MEDYTEHNEEVCEQYQRYVVEMLYQDMEYCTIWGVDKTSFNEEDKMLIDEQGHFLLFLTVEDAIAYVQQWDQAFDKSNWDGWLAAIKLPIEPDTVVDLDLLNATAIDVENVALFDHTVTAKNFASDYCYQIEDESWTDAFSGYPLMNFFDAFMDRHFWSGVAQPEPITEQLLADVVQQHRKLYAFLQSKIRLC
ncbi:MAG: hypothetical protein R2800_08285 [Flavipsychrobacter sp.]